MTTSGYYIAPYASRRTPCGSLTIAPAAMPQPSPRRRRSRVRPPLVTPLGTLPRRSRQRLHGVDHRHEAHPFPHRDVLPEDLFDDGAVDLRDFRRRKTRERLVENL